jgi:hypothetical protein
MAASPEAVTAILVVTASYSGPQAAISTTNDGRPIVIRA